MQLGRRHDLMLAGFPAGVLTARQLMEVISAHECKRLFENLL